MIEFYRRGLVARHPMMAAGPTAAGSRHLALEEGSGRRHPSVATGWAPGIPWWPLAPTSAVGLRSMASRSGRQPWPPRFCEVLLPRHRQVATDHGCPSCCWVSATGFFLQRPPAAAAPMLQILTALVAALYLRSGTLRA